MDRASYYAELTRRIGRILDAHPEWDDRAKYPWCVNFAGDPFSSIWFVQENCSLSGLRKAVDGAGLHAVAPPDFPWGDPRWLDTRWGKIQWGDWGVANDILNPALYRNGFRDEAPRGDGGGDLQCYFTNVMKTIVEVTAWRNLPRHDQLEVVEAWAPVLEWELDNGQPKMVVASGKIVGKYLAHLINAGLLHRPPELETTYHSACRRKDWPKFNRQMDEIRRSFDRVMVGDG